MSIYVEFTGDIRICPNCYKKGKIVHLDTRRGKQEDGTYKCVGEPISEKEELIRLQAKEQLILERQKWKSDLVKKNKARPSDDIKLPIEPNVEIPTGCGFRGKLEDFPRHKLQYINGQGYVFHDNLDGKGAVTLIHDDSLRNAFAMMKNFKIVEYDDKLHKKPEIVEDSKIHFDYDTLKVMRLTMLEEICKSRKLNPVGTKKELITRILINQGDDVDVDDSVAAEDGAT